MAAPEQKFPVEESGAYGAPRHDEVFVGSAHLKIRVDDEGAVVWLKFVEPLTLKEGGFSDECSDAQALTPRELETLSLVARNIRKNLLVRN